MVAYMEDTKMTIKNMIFATVLSLGIAACDDGGLGMRRDAGTEASQTVDVTGVEAARGIDAGSACQVLASPTGVTQPGVYAPPTGMDCAAIKSILQDGTPMDKGTFLVQCSSSPGRSFISVKPHEGNPTEMVFEACE